MVREFKSRGERERHQVRETSCFLAPLGAQGVAISVRPTRLCLSGLNKAVLSQLSLKLIVLKTGRAKNTYFLYCAIIENESR